LAFSFFVAVIPIREWLIVAGERTVWEESSGPTRTSDEPRRFASRFCFGSASGLP
jgi:hypothetical protein